MFYIHILFTSIVLNEIVIGHSLQFEFAAFVNLKNDLCLHSILGISRRLRPFNNFNLYFMCLLPFISKLKKPKID